MSKEKAIDIINNKIDALILAGKTSSDEYKRLLKLHMKLIKH